MINNNKYDLKEILSVYSLMLESTDGYKYVKIDSIISFDYDTINKIWLMNTESFKGFKLYGRSAKDILSVRHFIRVNRYSIVNIDKILSIKNMQVKLNTCMMVEHPIFSRKCYYEFKKKALIL